ncbi:hypothetical protein [Devosia sp. CAU 1758]
MSSNPHDGGARSETDRRITESGQGPAEKAALGSGYSSIVRIVVVVLLFIVIGGTVFYLAGGGI